MLIVESSCRSVSLHNPAVDVAEQQSAYKAHSKKPNEPWWQRIVGRTLDEPVALWTFVLTMFTGLLVFVSLRQFKYLRRADQTARIAANAARDAADAAKQSANITQAIEAARLIAKLASQKIDVADESALIDWSLEVTNVGRSVAGEISIEGTTYDIVGANGEYAEPEPIPPPVPAPSPHGEVLRPQESRTFYLKQQIPNWGQVLGRERSCIIRVNVSYRDILGRARVLPGCFYYSHRSKAFIPCPITRMH